MPSFPHNRKNKEIFFSKQALHELLTGFFMCLNSFSAFLLFNVFNQGLPLHYQPSSYTQTNQDQTPAETNLPKSMDFYHIHQAP